MVKGVKSGGGRGKRVGDGMVGLGLVMVFFILLFIRM